MRDSSRHPVRQAAWVISGGGVPDHSLAGGGATEKGEAALPAHVVQFQPLGLFHRVNRERCRVHIGCHLLRQRCAGSGGNGLSDEPEQVLLPPFWIEANFKLRIVLLIATVECIAGATEGRGLD